LLATGFHNRKHMLFLHFSRYVATRLGCFAIASASNSAPLWALLHKIPAREPLQRSGLICENGP